MTDTLTEFRTAYAQQRAHEGRAADAARDLPYVRSGPQARQWQVRARTYEAFMRVVMVGGTRLSVADLGAGNGWLSQRINDAGHRAIAIDIRTDDVDGLGAAPDTMPRLAGSFTQLPLATFSCDVTVFNASLHYALDLFKTLTEVVRITKPGGRIVIMDSPFYKSERAGAAMVAEKRQSAARVFGERADALMALPFIEFLTTERLVTASAPLGLKWRRHRVRYPVWYELRPWLARLRGQRAPSRFDLWEAVRP